MIPLRYDLTRWVIAVLTLLLIVLFVLLPLTGGASILFVLLIIASVGAIVSPPGIYVWLLRPVCPDCGGPAEVTVEQDRVNPYRERLVFHCPRCDKEKVEFNFDPT